MKERKRKRNQKLIAIVMMNEGGQTHHQELPREGPELLRDSIPAHLPQGIFERKRAKTQHSTVSAKHIAHVTSAQT
jgi:hypothetical protein